MEKAKARWRAPRPWRSPQETRLIKRLAWQWFIGEGPSCSLPDLARRLGVSQTYCQKLMRQFRSNPLSDLDLVLRGYGGLSISASGQLQEPRIRILTTFEELREAQEETKRMRERGYLHVRSMGASRWTHNVKRLREIRDGQFRAQGLPGASEELVTCGDAMLVWQARRRRSWRFFKDICNKCTKTMWGARRDAT